MHFRLWIIIAIATTVFGIGIGTQVSEAQVIAAYEIMDVREAQCYRHIVDLDDRLCINRYALVDDEGELSTNGAFIQIENATGTLATIFAPVEDYGLACAYWPSDDPQLPTWNATTTAQFHMNPFVTGATSTSDAINVFWNETETAGGNFEETGLELINDLPLIVLRLEQDSPDFDEGELVAGAGIMPLGKFFVEQCYPPLIQIASIAFVLEAEFAGEDFNPPDKPAFILNIENAAQNSQFTQSWAAMWEFASIPFSAAMILLVPLGLVPMFFAIRKFEGDMKAGFYFIWPMLLAAGYQGGFPFQFVVLISAGLFIFGVALFLRNVLPVGG